MSTWRTLPRERASAIYTAISLMLVSGASAWNDILNSVWGPKGNDTGGIIPWSPENERDSFAIATDQCARWNNTNSRYWRPIRGVAAGLSCPSRCLIRLAFTTRSSPHNVGHYESRFPSFGIRRKGRQAEGRLKADPGP